MQDEGECVVVRVVVRVVVGGGGGGGGGRGVGSRHRENSNSKTLFYKDCSLGSVRNLATSPW